MAHVEGLPVVQHLKANLIGNIADSVFNEGRVGISEKSVPYIAFSVTLKNDIGMGELIKKHTAFLCWHNALKGGSDKSRDS